MPKEPEPKTQPESQPNSAQKTIKDVAAEMATTSQATAHFMNGTQREQLNVKLVDRED